MKRLNFTSLSQDGFVAARTARILCCALLAGCAVGPDYDRPAIDLPTAYRAATAPSAASSAMTVDKEWWRLFQDETLNDLVAKAHAYNFDLQAAIARVEEADGLAREASAAFFPRIDLGASSSRASVTTVGAIPLPATSPRLRDSRQAALSASYELDLWGKIRRSSEAASADFLATVYARDTVELSVTGYVASTYVALRAADASLSLTQATLKSRERAFEIAKSRMDAGNASPLDLHQAEGALAAAQAQFAEFKRQRSLAESQLALLIGQPELSIQPDDLRRLPIPPTPPAGLPSELLGSRPDVRQAEATLVAANARIGVARAALFPSLSLTGVAGSESAALAKLFSRPAELWSLSAALAMPIFDAGRNFARIDQATARQKQALSQYLKSVQTAFKEVNDALAGLRENSEGDRAQAARAQAAEKTLELAQRRYEAGYSPFLEVLDAQRSANDARLAFISLRQARLNSIIDLVKALGGGWQDPSKAVADNSRPDTTGDRQRSSIVNASQNEGDSLSGGRQPVVLE